MTLTQKTVYALRAVFELTRRQEKGPIPIPVIAEAQAIPPRFLESILLQLKQAGILESVRGVDGGYRLARPPREITVAHVLHAMEGRISPVSCLGGKMEENCPMRDNCVFLPMWQRAHDATLAVYEGTSYADLLDQETAQADKHIPAFQI